MSKLKIFFASCVNDEQVLNENLLRSPDVSSGTVCMEILRNCTSASKSYNAVLEETGADIVVLLHQDVYLPGGWVDSLEGEIQKLEKIDSKWAVLGVVGATRDGIVGHLWSSGINREIGGHFTDVIAVEAIDELLLVINNRQKIRFDDHQPGFHLFGTDIVQSAKVQGYKSYVIDLPVIHNDRPKYILDSDYIKSYKYMQQKWEKYLPIHTCTEKIKKSIFQLHLRNLKFAILGENRPHIKYDSEKIAIELNYNN
jgi:Glycosyltransferase like family